MLYTLADHSSHFSRAMTLFSAGKADVLHLNSVLPSLHVVHFLWEARRQLVHASLRWDS